MTSTPTGGCRLIPSEKGAEMGLFSWLKRRKNRNTMHVTQVTRRTYEQMMRDTDPEPNPHLRAAAHRAESAIRRVPESSPSGRSFGQVYNDAALWAPTHGTTGSSSSGCSDSGSSSSSSDSGSSGGCD